MSDGPRQEIEIPPAPMWCSCCNVRTRLLKTELMGRKLPGALCHSCAKRFIKQLTEAMTDPADLKAHREAKHG